MNILEYENYQEQKQHGNPEFPYITYPCTIPLDFPSVPLHWHDDMEIIYIKKGSVLVNIDFKTYRLEEGSLALIIPGQLHSIEQDGNTRAEYENIIFNLKILSSTDLSYIKYISPLKHGQRIIPTTITPQDSFYNEAAKTVDEADELCKTFPPAYELRLRALLLQLFYILYSNSEGLTEEKQDKQDQRTLQLIRSAVKYVENNYSSPISTSDAAKNAGLSSSHFMKIFKNTTGKTFIDYLNDYRLQMASRLLLSSDDSILTVAADCGF